MRDTSTPDMDFSSLALKCLTSLAAPVTSAGLKKLKKLKTIENFRINQAIESAIAEVWDSLGGYFVAEKIGSDKAYLIAQASTRELMPFVEDPSLILKDSLDGEKLFESLRSANGFPPEIVDERLEAVYQMVFPLIASVICKTPVILEQIEEKSLAEILGRFDALKEQINTVISGINQVQQEPQRRTDELFHRVLQQALKKVLLAVEVIGLYGDSMLKQAKEEMFVLPLIVEKAKKGKRPGKGKKPAVNEKPDEHRLSFLSKYSRSVVRGAPGAGKSTWSRWLQVQALRESGILALHVKLRSYAGKPLPTVAELIKELVGPNMSTEVDSASIARWIQAGKISLIFDGFDEVSPAQRDSVLDNISESADYVESGPVVLTSRPLHSDQLVSLEEKWKQWWIEAFNEERITDYIRKWYRHAQLKEGANRDVDAYSLYETLAKDPHIAPLTGNPLMLATLLMVHHNDGSLPKGRSKLYDRYIDGMLGLWDDRQEVQADTSGIDRDKKKRILTSIAIALHLIEEDEMSDESCLALVKSALSKYGYVANEECVLDSLRERSGLIIGPGSYSFTHKSIGEYLVAKAICDGDRVVNDQRLDRFRLHNERNNDRWLNVLYFWAGSAPAGDLQAFMESMNESDDFSLLLGLLWDQMDRFTAEWLSETFRRAILGWANEPQEDTMDEFEFTHFYAWSFDEMIPEGQNSWIRLSHSPVRHILSSRGGDEKFIGELIEKCGEDLLGQCEVLTIPSYNKCLSEYIPCLQRLSDRVNFIESKATQWTKWLKMSQAACYISMSDSYESDFGKEYSQWKGDHAEDKMLTLWLTAAITVRLNPMTNDKTVADNFSKLHFLLHEEWSDKMLCLSNRWSVATPEGEEFNFQFQDLLNRIASFFDSLREGENQYFAKEKLVAAISKLQALLERRNELN